MRKPSHLHQYLKQNLKLKKKKEVITMAVHKFYEVSGGKAKKIKQSCPRCGPGVFLADHKNRLACGKCGYTEFKK